MRRLFFVIFICLTTGIVVSAHPSGPVQQESAIEGGRKGVVDGYHETMWAHDYRLSVIELASHLNIDEYVYAPEQDPYVGSSDWFMPYPHDSADLIKELMAACSRNGIVFTWCIRPDKDYSWSDADYNLLLGKFEMMHYMGVRSFGIILDDVPCAADEQWRKKELIGRVNTDFMAKKGVKPLLASFDGYYMPENAGETMKLGMYAYAGKSLEEAAEEIAPDVKEQLVRFVRNSDVWNARFSGTEDYIYEFIAADGYAQDDYDALMAEFMAVEDVPAAVSKSANKALYNEMRPWLEEFGKLGTRCRKVLECMSSYAAGDIPGFWSIYASNLMSEAERASYNEYPSGTGTLQPYYEKMMDELADAFDMDNESRVSHRHIAGDGMDTYIAPSGTSVCHLILNNPDGREVIVRLSDEAGRYTAEFCINESYFRFDMKGNAVKVEVLGDVPVFETVFVK